MFLSDSSKPDSNISISSQPNQNPFAQRFTPHSDIKTYISRAHSATDVKTKFDILEEIIKEFPANIKLARFFTDLLAEIFGLNDYPGWRLNTLNSGSHNDEILFQKVYGFLSPDGSLFKLIEKLEYDNATFDHPFQLLPKNIKDQSLRVGYLGGTQNAGIVPGSFMMLSQNIGAFEYYLSLFFGYILQPKVQKEPFDWNTENLYVSLYERYLTHFLPLKGSRSQGTVSLSDRGAKPVSRKDGALFGNGPIRSAYSSDARSIISSNGLRTLRPVTWKSETFVQMFRDIWLAYEKVQTQEYYLPGTDQVLLIRIFVKHLHHFLNEGRHNQKEASHSITPTNHEDELKRVILSMVQEKLFNFLKNCFQHWPLDASFKMVLETWLSYIQPWRYCNTTDVISQSNLDEWSEFIEENLIFYTVLFKMFMQRATRLDLHFLKDVQFIFRVTKVFAQLNLPRLLEEAESLVLASSSYPSMHHLSRTPLGHSYTAFRPSPGIDMEETVNEPMFDQQYMNQMQDLAKCLLNEAAAIQNANARHAVPKKTANSIFGKIREYFANKSDDDDDAYNDTKLEEKLELVSNQLAIIFNFNPLTTADMPDGQAISGEGQLPKPFISDKCYDDGRLLPEHVIESNGTVTLTEKGRLQILHKLRNFDIQGRVSSDLEPMKSYEIHFLVKVLHQLSTILNEKYKEQLKALYNRNDIVGKMLRTLSPRVVEYRGLSVKLPRSMEVGTIEPRVSLRFMASYYSLYYICWLLFVSKLFSLGLIEIVLLLFLLFVLFMLQNVVSMPVKISQKLD